MSDGRPDIRSIYRLSELEIDQLIDDVRQAEQGVRTYYAVDSHEVIDFCFPVHLDEARSPDPNQIADDQAALYEVFYNRIPRPLLLPDYEKELRRHLTYLSLRADDVYRTIEEIDKIVGNEPLDDVRDLSRDQILDKMESQFNTLLAVVMGIYSIGVERFRSVIENRLLRVANLDDAVVREAVSAYKTSPLAEEIYNELTKEIETGGWSEPEMYRKLASAENDARAVDWMIDVNKHLEAGNGRNSDKARVLYLSSAQRTRKIFSYSAVRSILERDFSKRHLHRSRAQMLALLVSTEPGAGATETIDNLKEIKAIIAEFKSVRQQRIATCDICVINGGEPENCDYLVTCRKMKVLESRRESAQNLGLLGRVRDYNQFLNAKPKSKTHLEYLDYFRRLIHTDNLGDLAIARMKAVLTLALTEGQIESKPHTEPPRRAATMPSYFLPVEPYVPNPVHRELVRMIFSYPNVALRDMISAKQLLRDALERFEVLDRETDRPDPYHELVRCLMYMAEREISHNTARGDANALEYAKKMASTHPELKAEFLYVITWTARRLDKFQEAHNAAKQGISEYPDDPRFFHGRSVNTFLWLDNDKQRKYCPASLADAVADAEAAFELYSKHAEGRAAVMAIQLNNIAWARCADPKSPLYDLSGARSALDRLKAVLPPAEWLPRFPSFLHTEASVEVAESDMAVNQGADPSLVLSKLERARKAIKEAVNAGDGQAGQPYAAFKDKIERKIERLEKKVTGR